MTVEPKLAQDVWKDAGKHVQFTVLELKRQDQKHEQEVITAFADRYQAILRSLHIRDNEGCLRATFGFSSDAWDYLFPNAPKPKSLFHIRLCAVISTRCQQLKGIFSSTFGLTMKRSFTKQCHNLCSFYVISPMLLMKRRAFVTLKGGRSSALSMGQKHPRWS